MLLKIDTPSKPASSALQRGTPNFERGMFMFESDNSLWVFAAILIPILLLGLFYLFTRIRDKILEKIAVSLFFGIGRKKNRL